MSECLKASCTALPDDFAERGPLGKLDLDIGGLDVQAFGNKASGQGNMSADKRVILDSMFVGGDSHQRQSALYRDRIKASKMIKKTIVKISFCLLAIYFLNPQFIFSQESPFPKRTELEGKKVGTYAIKPGTFFKHSADFGRILIPENRKKKNSRLIHLIFIRVRALEDNTAEPIFLLNGGPGKSNIRGILSSEFFKHNDLVIVGYRGIDTSVTLESPEVAEAMTVNNPLSPSGMKHIREVIRSTYNRFKRDGVDIDGYTVLEVVDDLDAVREALGYKKINLFSSSYGTILAYRIGYRFSGLQTVHVNLVAGCLGY